MATIRKRASGTWEIIIRRKGVLQKAHYATAATEQEAQAYARTIEGMLNQGVIPLEIIQDGDLPAQSLDQWLRQYLVKVHISESDNILLNRLLPKSAQWRVVSVNMAWAQGWISEMKQVDRLAPGSIRHKVGAVARFLDWCVNNEWLAMNPLRALPKRYASYTPVDGEKKVDIERDRRLLSGEYERIIEVLTNDLRVKGRPAWRLLFILAIETAMRLSELYTLTSNQVDIQNRTIFLDKTKNGSKRQVPLSSVAVAELSAWLDHIAEIENMTGTEMIFPFWNGRDSLRLVTMRLSKKWSRIAAWANCDDLHFHDLRHHAVCTFYEKTNLSDLEIAKITGHKTFRCLMRYANLRASDLAGKLW
jgi:integrase